MDGMERALNLAIRFPAGPAKCALGHSPVGDCRLSRTALDSVMDFGVWHGQYEERRAEIGFTRGDQGFSKICGRIVADTKGQLQ